MGTEWIRTPETCDREEMVETAGKGRAGGDIRAAGEGRAQDSGKEGFSE